MRRMRKSIALRRVLADAVPSIGLLAVLLAGCGGGGGGEPSPPPEQIAVVIAAGDIAQCDTPLAPSTPAMSTALLVESIPGTVLTLGDNVYYEGTAA